MPSRGGRERETLSLERQEASRLQLEQEHRSITSAEQKRLGVLQAKMEDDLDQRLDRANRLGHSIARTSPDPRKAPLRPRPPVVSVQTRAGTASSSFVQRMKIPGVWKMQLTDSGQKKRYTEILNGKTNTDDMDVKTLETLIEFLEETLLKDAVVKLKHVLEEKTSGEPKVNEAEKLQQQLKKEQVMLGAALSRLGSETTWKELQPAIEKWWKGLKAAEAGETFEAAFKQNRMTARQINQAAQIRGESSTGLIKFPVKNQHDPQKKYDREITLGRDVHSILERNNPKNFYDPAAEGSKKNEKGLHNLSASLLNGESPISDQLKGYEDSIVLFMPVPPENDLQIFAALNSLEDRNPEVMAELASKMTRLELAQASDMGTRFVDAGRPGAPEGDFQYGITGTIIREEGGSGQPATASELAARRTNALEYTKIAESGITKVNEVVMAYRAHESKLFPMFAVWDQGRQGYAVVDGTTQKPTGQFITNQGKMV